MISAVIIAKNEELMLPDCLKSLDWVDEILVIDDNSTDKTVPVAKKYKARVVHINDKGNFAEKRNKGLREAKGDWILYIDADERITPELRKEISDVMESPKSGAFAIPRRNFIFGKEFKHCGQWPDYQKRFFKKSDLRGWIGNVHETPQFEGSLTLMKNPMLHIKHESLSEMVEKTNNWSEIEARLMFEAHHPRMNIRRFLSAILREFWLRMIKQMAFLDGGEGIIYAMYQVFSRFVSYAKLWEMQINKKGTASK